MKSLIFFTVICLIFKSEAADQKSIPAEVKIAVVENIKDYLQANPNATLIPMKMARQARLNQNWYTLGSRQQGDGLVAIDNGWAQYPSKQNVELSVYYPRSGVGALITYVQVLMTQDTGTSGRGYVVAGGIGQRYISLVVEAWNTAYVRYDYSIFGY
jgi:hypothetical protein